MILVDTHALIWLTQRPELLSATAKRVLVEERHGGGLAISDMTLHEIAFLVTRGRVLIDAPLDVYLHFVERMVKVLPISGAVAQRAHEFTAGYPRDPADRIIGATAVVHGIQLVTRDEAIRASGEVGCVW